MTGPEGRVPTPRADAGSRTPAADRRPAAAPKRRSGFEVRWRQFRRAPRPVVRAVVTSLVVAGALGIAYLVYDVALTRGAVLPGGDLRPAAVAAFVAAVAVVGSLVTYLVVPGPPGGSGRSGRTAWSAVLGFLAALPIAYLALVLEGQLIRPLLA